MATAVAEPEIVDVPDDYELIHGQLVEVPPMSWYACEVVNRMNDKLVEYGVSRKVGRSRVEMYYRVPTEDDPTKIRRADISFITFGRLPDSKALPYTGNAVDIVPELIVEVISPTDDAEDVIEK